MRKFLCLLLMLAVTVGAFSACSSKPYDYELDKYLTIPDWLNITVSEDEIDGRLQKNINSLLESKATESEITGRGVIAGDKVNISFLCYLASDYGKKDAKPIDVLSDESCNLIVGELKYFTSFEAQIIQHFVNDNFSVRMTIPENYGLSEYASAHVVYDVTLNSITERTIPTLTDDIVRSVSEYKTVNEYKLAQKERARKELLFEKILSLAEVKSYPESELASYERDYVNYYSTAASSAGYTLEQYVNKKFFITLTQFHSEGSEYAKELVKKDLLLYQFIRIYRLEPTDDEYRAGAEKYAKMYGLSSVSSLEAKFGEEFVRKSVSYDKVLDYIGSVIKPSTEKAPS